MTQFGLLGYLCLEELVHNNRSKPWTLDSFRPGRKCWKKVELLADLGLEQWFSNFFGNPTLWTRANFHRPNTQSLTFSNVLK